MQTTNHSKNIQPNNDKMLEQILVVAREKIQNFISKNGIQSADSSQLKALIENNSAFIPRGQAESDTNFKQIIPYLVFTHNKQLFLMQRSENASETRLASKYSLGIGGHLREKDLTTNNLFEWTQREFLEEVDFQGEVTAKFIGTINDESNFVGQVHTGLLWLIEASTSNIKVREELKSGELVSLEYCKENYDKLESWSQMVVDYLLQNNF